MATKTKYVVALATLLLLGSLAAMSAVGQSDNDEGPPPQAALEQVTAIEAAAQDAMDVLDEPRDSTDALSPELAAAIDAKADFGMNSELSRLAIGNATHSLFVLPANGFVCTALTIGEGAALSCSETVDIANGESTPGVATVPSGIAVYGLVTDEVSAVTIKTGEADTLEAEITNNAYYKVLPAGTPLRSVAYIGPSGPVEYAIWDPSADDPPS